jgi:Rab GDP dissociation inhibitor
VLDIYIAVVSSVHAVCPKGYYIAIVSTVAEGTANHHLELQPGLDRLGSIKEIFMGPPTPIYEPLESGQQDRIFISKSYDATSHFETTTGMAEFQNLQQKLTESDDIRDIYQRVAGEPLIVEGLREGQSIVAEE